MKLYISVDMEGISGLTQGSYMNPGNSEYLRYRKMMTTEVNAVIEGALEAGATEILVNDGHSSMKNILIEDLHPECRLITGYPRKYLQLTELDNSFDAILFVGYHAPANSKGIFAHTFSKFAVNSLKINGSLCSEADFNSIVAGFYNVPVIFVSGDDILCEQLQSWFPSELYYQTKKALSEKSGVCIPPQKSLPLIRKMVQNAVNQLKQGEKFPMHQVSPPFRMEIEAKNVDQALIGEMIPGFKRTGDLTIEFITEDIIELQNALNTYVNATCILVLPVFQ